VLGTIETCNHTNHYRSERRSKSPSILSPKTNHLFLYDNLSRNNSLNLREDTPVPFAQNHRPRASDESSQCLHILSSSHSESVPRTILRSEIGRTECLQVRAMRIIVEIEPLESRHGAMVKDHETRDAGAHRRNVDMR
jgi:hypothetical protein